MMLKTNGFTFIELLLVLMITSIFTVIGIKISFNILENQYEKQFFHILNEDLRYIQNLALSDAYTEARITFNPSSYRVTTNQSHSNFDRKYPAGWIFEENAFNRITFNTNGTLRSSGTVFLKSSSKLYKVVFPLGKGSYYVSIS